MKWMLGAAVLIVALSTGAAANYECSEEKLDCTAKEIGWIDASKGQVRRLLRDPKSAQFSRVVVYQYKGARIVCGQVNARNSFGGMGGPQGFIAAGSNFAYLESDVKFDEWPVLVNTLCR